MPRKTLALVTIGQAPREDLTPDMLPELESFTVIEEGALDSLSRAAVSELAPHRDEGTLVTRLCGGDRAVVSEERVLPLVEEAVARAASAGADAIFIVCTGDIAGIAAPVPVFLAESLAHGAMAELAGGKHLTVVVPAHEQAAAIGRRWRNRLGRDVTVVVCDPYAGPPGRFAELGELLQRAGSSPVLLDCIGYSEAMAELLRAQTHSPVYTARRLAGRRIADLL